MREQFPASEEVARFLYREARLIDEKRFDEWLSLFTEDAVYWCPANRDDADPMRSVSIFYDDAQRIKERVLRLKSGNAFSQDPPSRTRHLIANVEVSGEANGAVVVYSNFLILEVRQGAQRVHGGQYEHHLRRDDREWRIALKKVSLINNDLPVGNLTFLV